MNQKLQLEIFKYSEIISPEDYLNMNPSVKANIERTQIIAPVLGKDDFGRIKVLYRIPVYRQSKIKEK